MSTSRVIVYTTDFCGYCERAKQLLGARGIEFQEVAVPRTPEGRDQLLEVAPHARTFPQIVISGEPVGGYRALLKLDETGDLSRLAS